MKTSPEMPFNIGDYLSDTMGLSRSEHGSYVLLIMAYWKNGGPLTNDDESLRQIALCPEAEWMRTKGIMERFFDTQNGTWTHKRIDKELAEDAARRGALARASAAGVEKRRELGQIPSVRPSVNPTVVSSNIDRISKERQMERNQQELGRVEARVREIRECAPRVAGGGVLLKPKEREELRALVARKAELLKAIGYMA